MRPAEMVKVPIVVDRASATVQRLCVDGPMNPVTRRTGRRQTGSDPPASRYAPRGKDSATTEDEDPPSWG